MTRFADALIQDLRYALRTFGRARTFTMVAVVTLALGIGATTGMFTIVDAALFRGLPFAEPDRIVMVYLTARTPDGGAGRMRWSYPEFELLRARTQSLEALAAFNRTRFNLTGGDEPVRVQGEVVSAGYFELLGVAPMGRGFAAGEDRIPGAHPVVILGHGLWRRQFGSDSTVLGRVIRVNGIELSVVGVAPPGFRGLSGRAELWVPQAMGPLVSYPGQLTDHQHFHNVAARLRADVELPEALAELAVVGREVVAEQSAEELEDAQWGATAQPLATARIDPANRRAQLVLFGAVSFVLLIACANLANLLLARGFSREREITIRSALGSSRGRLVRQLLTESVVLALGGGALGLLVALWMADIAPAIIPERLPTPQNDYAQLSEFIRLSIDLRVVGFAVFVSTVTGILAGMAPAFRATHPESLRGGVMTSSAPQPRGRRRGAGALAVLVVVQFALAMTLVAGASLLARSHLLLQQRDFGFEPDGVLTMFVSPAPTQYRGVEAPVFLERLLTRIEMVPGVEAASVDLCTPLMGSCARTQVRPLGASTSTAMTNVGRHYVAPDYFAALRIPVLRGRVLSANDRTGGAPVAVVNQTAARLLWPGQDPIGRQLVLGEGAFFGSDSVAQVVGVVGDVAYGPPDLPIRPEIYTSYRQFTWPYAYVMLRVTRDPAELIPALGQAVRNVDAALPIDDIMTMEQRVGTALAKTRFSAVLLGSFAGLALVLAGIGIYGVMAHYVSRRRREMGVRLALGADRADVLRLVVGRGLVLAGTGIVLGLAGALSLTRVLEAQLFEIRSAEPVNLIGSALGLGLVAVIACLLPARRAVQVNPAHTLRAE